ncbi:MAG: Pr6Pr family membrane protein [Hamadaea sp.]|uniref:Pr6Pr family membrane protein n=1 Tax=Hamadaea sp. TaxID=2024425 RepID=UPI001816DE5D|nr:Pr6Pr family membrane protein [Hamadaea sp.]NUR69950.1 Pr6Pr family membrane protein [Hamadaea sp.]NUT20668.1 Pr6Pr family membrane protein [Hamadaea sp.]
MEYIVRAYRALMAIAIIAAIVAQLSRSNANGILDTGNFFSYFTIQSNLIGAAVLGVGAIRPRLDSPRWDSIRGAATTYLFTTGVVFALLLSNLAAQVGTTMPWVNSVLHQISPVVIFLDWLIRPPRNQVTLPSAWLWLIYPMLWLVYALIRGGIVDWYPYPFVDPRPDGWAHVIKSCFAIAIGIIGFMLIVMWAGNSMRRWYARHSPGSAGSGI